MMLPRLGRQSQIASQHDMDTRFAALPPGLSCIAANINGRPFIIVNTLDNPSIQRAAANAAVSDLEQASPVPTGSRGASRYEEG